MFGIILSVYHHGVSTQKVEGFKTRQDAEKVGLDWKKTFKETATFYTIYEMPDKPGVQAPTDGTFVDMRPKDLYSDMYDLHRLVSCLKELINTDPTMPPAVIADVSQADYLADKIFHAIPDPDEEPQDA